MFFSARIKMIIAKRIPGKSPLPIGNCSLPIAYCVLPITRCLLPIAHCLLPIAFCLITLQSSAQSLYLPQGDRHQHFLERLEIMLQKNPELNIASARTISRRDAVYIAGMEDSSSGSPNIRLTKVDQANLQSLLRNNAEWVTRLSDKKGAFYRNPANMIEVNRDKFFLAVNPMLQAEYSKEKDYDESVYHYAAGMGVRSMIGSRVGLYASAVYHNEKVPSFVLDRVNEYNSLPGAGKVDRFGVNGFRYWDVRGGITFKALKYFDFTVAYDRNFIGNGYRSLFLSDFAKNYVFGKAVTRIWKFRYTHIYAPMIPQFEGERQSDLPVGRRMTAIHHLSINATKWLNVAAFQTVSITNRKDWMYMVPVMFYPVSQIRNTKPANNLGGFEFKANIAKKHQLYGQLLIDNLSFKELKKGSGWWNNRYGVQLGAKTINLFGVKNLDLQVEMNAVRPFTYAADSDTLGSYTHYNQPLAHPLGANFFEGVLGVKYPLSRLTVIHFALFKWVQGTDSTFMSYGSNILKSSDYKYATYGFTVPTGVSLQRITFSVELQSFVAENFEISLNFNLRKNQNKENFSQNWLFFSSVKAAISLWNKLQVY